MFRISSIFFAIASPSSPDFVPPLFSLPPAQPRQPHARGIGIVPGRTRPGSIVHAPYLDCVRRSICVRGAGGVPVRDGTGGVPIAGSNLDSGVVRMCLSLPDTLTGGKLILFASLFPYRKCSSRPDAPPYSYFPCLQSCLRHKSNWRQHGQRPSLPIRPSTRADDLDLSPQ